MTNFLYQFLGLIQNRIFTNNGFSGVVEYSGSTDRDNFDSHTLTFIARLQF